MGSWGETVQFDHALLQKYNTLLPRYTSYPPATTFTTDCSELDFRSAIAASNYCHTPCYRFERHLTLAPDVIGTDHFAKSTDALTLAQPHHTLKCNFQGYNTQFHTELLGFGLGAISLLEDTYTQNYTQLGDYYHAIEMGCLPISQGLKLGRADLLRRDVIMQLMLNGYLIKSEFADRYGISFDTYFAPELDAFKSLEIDGLVKLLVDAIEVTLVGRLLIRTVAHVFDGHTRGREQLSMVI